MEDNRRSNDNPAINKSSSGSAASSRKYQGNLTSKEAGNIVRDMIREQERAMMAADQKADKN